MIRLPHRSSLPLLAAMALGACGDPGGATASLAMESGPRFDAVEELRLGHLDDPDLGFSRPARLDVDAEGRLYVLEAMVPEIRVFDAEGAFLHRIGARGEGPGEFQGAPRFGVRGDTLWTLETFNGRLTLFSTGGEVLRTGVAEQVVVPLPSAFAYVVPHTLRPDGRFAGYLGLIRSARDADPTGVEPTDSIPWPIVAFDLTGAVVDTLGWAPKPPPRMWRPPWEDPGMPEIVEIAGRPHIAPAPPPALPSWLPLADGFVVVETPEPASAEGGSLSVTRTDLAGDTLYHRRLTYTPVAYTDAELDSIAARAARGEAGGFAPYNPDASAPADWEAIAARLRDAMDFPAFRLPLSYPWLADDGSVWLRRAGGEAEGSSDWVVLDPDGAFRGRLRLPWEARPLWARGDTLWASLPDDLDIPWLVRYRLVPGE